MNEHAAVTSADLADAITLAAQLQKEMAELRRKTADAMARLRECERVVGRSMRIGRHHVFTYDNKLIRVDVESRAYVMITELEMVRTWELASLMSQPAAEAVTSDEDEDEDEDDTEEAA